MQKFYFFHQPFHLKEEHNCWTVRCLVLVTVVSNSGNRNIHKRQTEYFYSWSAFQVQMEGNFFIRKVIVFIRKVDRNRSSKSLELQIQLRILVMHSARCKIPSKTLFSAHCASPALANVTLENLS